jgi:hypothetical protein
VRGVSRAIDRIEVTFDDETLVADAGLIVPATLMVRLGLEQLINRTVRLVGQIGGALPGRKVLTLVAAILVGGSHIDHADRLRAGATQAVLPFRVMAPSTLGTFLRAFTFGHIRQLDRVIETIRRAWGLGDGPGSNAMTIDLDSTICEVHGKAKHGAAYGYTKVFGYHPLLATRADTGEVLHARLRKGSSQRGAKRFVEELIARVRRGGAAGALTLRADSGFFSWELIKTLNRLGVAWSITVSQNRSVARRSPPSTTATGSTSPTPMAATPKSPRRPTSPAAAQPNEASVTSGSWCAGPASPILPKPSCGPTGGTTRSSPTSNLERSLSTNSTVTTPPSNSPFATSNKAPGSSTAHRDGSSPTPPGWAVPCSPTT